MHPTLLSRGDHQSWWPPSFDLRLETPASFQALSPQRYSDEVDLAALVALPALLTVCWSRRSARVSSLPHSLLKRVLSEYHTERGPPSAIRSLHSSHTRMTFLEELFNPPLFSCGGRLTTWHTQEATTTSTSFELTHALVHLRSVKHRFRVTLPRYSTLPSRK